jgi:protein-L-isoaspartate(D-aspartate) O-methyltransferase
MTSSLRSRECTVKTSMSRMIPTPPFDEILVTAGATDVPQPLIDQLKPGGRMVIPVGPTSTSQILKIIEKLSDGSTQTREVIPIRFVPCNAGDERN